MRYFVRGSHRHCHPHPYFLYLHFKFNEILFTIENKIHNIPAIGSINTSVPITCWSLNPPYLDHNILFPNKLKSKQHSLVKFKWLVTLPRVDEEGQTKIVAKVKTMPSLKPLHLTEPSPNYGEENSKSWKPTTYDYNAKQRWNQQWNSTTRSFKYLDVNIFPLRKQTNIIS